MTETANLFRSLGVGPTDTVAYLLPNSIETPVVLLAGATAGIVNPINPLLDSTQIAGILRETNAKVLVDAEGLPQDRRGPEGRRGRGAGPRRRRMSSRSTSTATCAGLKRYIVPLIGPR